MRDIEKKIIESLQHNVTPTNLLKSLANEPYGKISFEFINHPLFQALLSKGVSYVGHGFRLLVQANDYLLNKQDPVLAQEKLAIVKQSIARIFSDITAEKKEMGTAQFPLEWMNYAFMRQLYGSNDEDLIAAFLEFFPKPKSHVFAGHNLPQSIAQSEEQSIQYVKNVLEKNEHDLAKVEKQVVKLQRIFRSKRREKQNIARIAPLYKIETSDVRRLMNEANTPYKPQCNERLAQRIIKAVKDIELFNEVTHYTSINAINSIMNDGLYGRHTLTQFYMPFSPASLHDFDIQHGDLNVVCLGAKLVDHRAKQGLELRFDAKKIAADNPSVFFKQRDLGFYSSENRSVTLGRLKIDFSHTSWHPKRRFVYNESRLLLFGGLFFDDNYIAGASIQNALLISNNLKEMHQILALNFFRFIDKLEVDNERYAAINPFYPTRERIYSALGNLNDTELKNKLKEIGQHISDAMEFNFYGAYKIDFDALNSITAGNRTLHMANLMKLLQENNTSQLNKTIEQWPELFSSYRFVDYLLKNAIHEPIKKILQEQRRKCYQPHLILALRLNATIAKISTLKPKDSPNEIWAELKDIVEAKKNIAPELSAIIDKTLQPAINICEHLHTLHIAGNLVASNQNSQNDIAGYMQKAAEAYRFLSAFQPDNALFNIAQHVLLNLHDALDARHDPYLRKEREDLCLEIKTKLTQKSSILSNQFCSPGKKSGPNLNDNKKNIQIRPS